MNIMQIEFIPIDFDSVDIEGKSMVRMFGRTKEGKSCCVIDTCEPYFWLIPKKKVDIGKYIEKIKKIKMLHAGRYAEVVDVQIKAKKHMGKEVKALQVFVNNPKDITVIKDIAKEFKETEAKREIDFNFVTRYIIEKDVKPLRLHAVEGKELSKSELLTKDIVLNVDLVIQANSIKLLDGDEFKPKLVF